eukprot:Pgem_evm1s18097
MPVNKNILVLAIVALASTLTPAPVYGLPTTFTSIEQQISIQQQQLIQQQQQQQENIVTKQEEEEDSEEDNDVEAKEIILEILNDQKHYFDKVICHKMAEDGTTCLEKRTVRSPKI